MVTFYARQVVGTKISRTPVGRWLFGLIVVHPLAYGLSFDRLGQDGKERDGDGSHHTHEILWIFSVHSDSDHPFGP